MQNYSLSGKRLGRQALLFPLCLVLYEFSTYIGNDIDPTGYARGGAGVSGRQ